MASRKSGGSGARTVSGSPVRGWLMCRAAACSACRPIQGPAWEAGRPAVGGSKCKLQRAAMRCAARLQQQTAGCRYSGSRLHSDIMHLAAARLPLCATRCSTLHPPVTPYKSSPRMACPACARCSRICSKQHSTAGCHLRGSSHCSSGVACALHTPCRTQREPQPGDPRALLFASLRIPPQ